MYVIHFPLLVLQSFGQLFALSFVFGFIILILPYRLFIFLNPSDMFILICMQFIEQESIIFLDLPQFCLQLLIPEGGGLYILIYHFLHLDYLLDHLLYLYWPINVYWLYAHLSLDSTSSLQLACQAVHVQLQLGDTISASRMSFVCLVHVLPGAEKLSLSLFSRTLKSCLQLLHLIVLGSKVILQFLHLGSDQLESFLKFSDTMPQVFIFSIFLAYFSFVLIFNLILQRCQFIVHSLLPCLIATSLLAAY